AVTAQAGGDLPQAARHDHDQQQRHDRQEPATADGVGDQDERGQVLERVDHAAPPEACSSSLSSQPAASSVTTLIAPPTRRISCSITSMSWSSSLVASTVSCSRSRSRSTAARSLSTSAASAAVTVSVLMLLFRSESRRGG